MTSSSSAPYKRMSSSEKDDIVESLFKASNLDESNTGSNSFTSITSSGTKQTAILNKFKSLAKGARDYKKGEAETIKKVLDEIDLISIKRTSEGFNEFNFSIGVFNCFFISYMFGAHPENLWLVYLVEGLYLLPRKFYNMWNAKPMNQALYYLDFCWMMNFTALFVVGALAFLGKVDDESRASDVAREAFFNAVVGVSCGTLMGANIVLPFVACLFHDVNTMTGLFIHLMPPMVMYTFLWHWQQVKAAWPEIFHFSYMDNIHYLPKDGGLFVFPGSSLDCVVGNSIVLYLLWWIPYVCFMLLVGIDLPKKFREDGVTPKNPKYDTVFHSTMRQGLCIAIGKTFRGRSKRDSLKQMEENNFDLIDFGIYMFFHAFAALGAFYIIGWPCFENQSFHLFMLVFVAWLAVTRGSRRYTYYTTKMYSRTIRKQYANILDETKNK